MRGMPNNPVTCSVCGSPWGFPKDGLCPVCRNLKRRKYIWTPALDDELRRIYADNARRRDALGAALHAFQRRLGWPMNALTSRAMVLRITTYEKHPWTRKQDMLLQSLVGRKNIRFISKALRRSEPSIRCRLARLRLSGRYLDGYSKADLQMVFGVGQHTVSRWIAGGWFGEDDEGRFDEQQVRKFLRARPEQYDLKRV